MSKPTIEQLAIENADLKDENKTLTTQMDALKHLLGGTNKELEDGKKRQEMIRRMLISSERITAEEFDMLERIVAPLDQ